MTLGSSTNSDSDWLIRKMIANTEMANEVSFRSSFNGRLSYLRKLRSEFLGVL